MLERIVDRVGLKQTIVYLATVCEAKEDHVFSNWQDLELARAWGQAAAYLRRASETDKVIKLPQVTK